MRILVFSDTHHNVSRAFKIINTIIGTDAVIHCGDVLNDAEELSASFPNIKFYSVAGNCDAFGAQSEAVLNLGNKRIFITHGHRYNVKSETEFEYPTIRERGRELKADAVIFGHTHIPYNKNWGNMIVMNPGSIKYEGTYGVIEIENNKLRSVICDVF